MTDENKPKKASTFKTIVATSLAVAGGILLTQNYNTIKDEVQDFFTTDLAELSSKYANKLAESDAFNYRDAIASVARKTLESLDDSTATAITTGRIAKMDDVYQREAVTTVVSGMASSELSKVVDDAYSLNILDTSHVKKSWFNKNVSERAVGSWYKTVFAFKDLSANDKNPDRLLFEKAYTSMKQNALYTSDSTQQVAMLDDSLKVSLATSYLESTFDQLNQEMLEKSKTSLVSESLAGVKRDGKLDELAFRSYTALESKFK